MHVRAALTLSFALFFTLVAEPARAEAPPPSQALASDPGPPFPRIGLSVDGFAIAFADYGARVEWAPERWISTALVLGVSRRHGGDAALAELALTAWPLGWGLEGLFVSPAIGIAYAGPWNGENVEARTVGRFGGDVGWQFLWGDLSIALGAGATGFVDAGTGAIWVEPRGRIALGVTFR